jgi:hypothetical protein
MVLLTALPEQRLELLSQPVDVVRPPPRRLPPLHHVGTHQHAQEPAEYHPAHEDEYRHGHFSSVL